MVGAEGTREDQEKGKTGGTGARSLRALQVTMSVSSCELGSHQRVLSRRVICEFSIPVTTNLVGLNNTIYYLTVLEVRSYLTGVKSVCWQGCISSRGSRGESIFLAFSASIEVPSLYLL